MTGDILRRERERQNLSIKDIEKATSIRALYIEAIENGENDKLPGSVYVKGFIKNYANFLNLDGEELVRQYREEMNPGSTTPEASGESKTETPKPEKQSDEPAKAEVKTEAPKTVKSSASPASNDGNRNSLMAVAAVLIFAICGGLFYYFNNVEGGDLAKETPAVQTPAETAEPKAVEQLPTPSPAASVASAATTGVNLEAKFTGRCWTKVIVDGIVAYEGTAEQGESLSWQANNQIDITAGNAGAIEFVENGVNLGVAGAVGDVIEKTFVKK